MDNKFDKFIKSIDLPSLFKTLEKESIALFRYERNPKSRYPYSAAQWQQTVMNLWRYHDMFPSLHKEGRIYDKREVAICFAMTVGMSLNEANHFLDALSVKDRAYESRRLYPLHFKEGFFSMLMAWGDKNGKRISFSDAVDYYNTYEKRLFCGLLSQYQKSERRYLKDIAINEKTKDSDGQTRVVYFRGLCRELAETMQGWTCPLRLEEQDQMQRMIVLLSHYERCMDEVQTSQAAKSDLSEKTADVARKNRFTRERAQRGTALGLDIVAKCAARHDLGDAIDLFLKEAIPAMGEAYWRSLSLLLSSYAESGGRVSAEDYARNYAVLGFLSAGNIENRKFRSVSIFDTEIADEERILSFALGAGELKELIHKSSSNPVLVASLFSPREQGTEEIFGKPTGDISQTAISCLVRSYDLWCRGKIETVSRGQRRFPTPYYNYRRKTMIRFALACGCRRYKELIPYLELCGSPDLNREDFAESMVYNAFIDSEKKKRPVIETILKMQRAHLMKITSKIYSSPDNGKNEIYTYGGDAVGRKILREAGKYCEDILYSEAPTGMPDKEAKIYYASWIYILLLLKLMGLEETLPQELQRVNAYSELFHENGGVVGQISEAAGNAAFRNMVSSGRETILVSILLEGWHKLEEAMDIARYGSSADWEEFFRYGIAVAATAESVFQSGEYGKTEDAGLDAAVIKTEIIGITDKAKNIRDDLEGWCVYWALKGGCKNFSLSFYEKKFRVEHFYISDDPAGGVTRMRKVASLKDQMDMWDYMLADLERISNCYEYLERNNPDRLGELKGLETSFVTKVRKVGKAASLAAKYLRRGLDDAEIAEKYDHYSRELEEYKLVS